MLLTILAIRASPNSVVEVPGGAGFVLSEFGWEGVPAQGRRMAPHGGPACGSAMDRERFGHGQRHDLFSGIYV